MSILAAGAVVLVVLQLRDIQNTVHNLDSQVADLQEANKGVIAGVAGIASAGSPRERAARAPVVHVQPQKSPPPPPAPKSSVVAVVGEESKKTKNENVAAPANNSPPPPAPYKAPPPVNKEDYVWPVVLPEWGLVPDGNEDMAPINGEGKLTDAQMTLERAGRGILYNAIHRDTSAKRPSKPLVGAIKGATRMRAALAERRALDPTGAPEEEPKFILFTEREPHLFMLNTVLCRAGLWPECATYTEDIKVFDYIKFYDDLEIPGVIERRERFQTWPALWVKRIMASLNSPFAETLVVDSDVYGCTNFEDLWTKYLKEGDVAATLAPAPFGASRNYKGAFRPGFPKSYEDYQERNLGLHMLATGRPQVLKLVALFRDVFIRQANDTAHVSIGNDQCAFREALFSLKATLGVTESLIPESIGCRHESGCADGCLVVHRHKNQEMSRAELKALKKKQNDEKKEKKRLEKEAAAAAL